MSLAASSRSASSGTWITVPVVLVVAFLALYPIGWLLFGSLRTAAPFEAGSFTLSNFVVAYSDPQVLRTIWNTLVFAAGQAVISTVLGTALAWVVTRTNTPGRGAIEFMTLLLFLFPLIMAVFAWTLLLSPSKGLINNLIAQVFGTSNAVFDVYSMGGMIFVQSLYVTPLAFLIVAPALATQDASLEEAARMSGAGTLRTTFTVTLPLAWPAILSALILIFIVGLESFDVPQLLGAPVGIFTYPSLIYHAIATRFPPAYGTASALAVSLLLTTAICVWIYQRATSQSHRFQTVKGKGHRAAVMDLGGWKWLSFALCALFFFIAAVLPAAVLLMGSFLRFFGRLDFRVFERMTTSNYPRVLAHPAIADGFINSLLLGLVGGLVCVLLAALVAIIVQKTKLPGRRTLEGVAMLPISFPATVLGLALLWAWIAVPLPVYGTVLILGIAYVTRFLPIALRTVSGGVIQISDEFDEAARMAGASWSMRLRTIFLPLLRPSLAAAWVLMFMLFFRELGMSVLLVGTGNPVLSVVMFDFYQSGELGLLCALSVLMTGLVIAVVAAARWLLGVRFSQFGV